MTKDELIALADRVEALTKPDPAIDVEVIRAVGGKKKSDDWWIGFSYIGRYAPAYTASLDAALTMYVTAPDMIHSCPRKVTADALRQRSATVRAEGDAQPQSGDPH